ncbi:dolichol phosphate-mannose biosynthesis regulatory protein (DPM2) domain-containing protein [Hirsutella rhossiliensis]
MAERTRRPASVAPPRTRGQLNSSLLQPASQFSAALLLLSDGPNPRASDDFDASEGTLLFLQALYSEVFLTTLLLRLYNGKHPWSLPSGTRAAADVIPQLDKLVGLAMLVAASVVFLYYTVWTLLMPFVDDDHPLQNFFLPRVWAIRIPVILVLLGSAVVGSFLSMVMIRSNRKKAAKAKAAAKKKA